MKVNHPSIRREEIIASFIPLLSACNAPTDIVKIMSTTRMTEYVYARMIIAVCLRNHGFTLSQIGYVVNRDHSAVIHLLKRSEDSKYGLDFKVMQAFRNRTLTESVNNTVINYHKERVKFHQGVIDNLKNHAVLTNRV